MTNTGLRAPLRMEQTLIKLVARPDRRQLPTRRAVFRGGRRIDDAIEALELNSPGSAHAPESGEGEESAIVMGWASPPPGYRVTIADR